MHTKLLRPISMLRLNFIPWMENEATLLVEVFTENSASREENNLENFRATTMRSSPIKRLTKY